MTEAEAQKKKRGRPAKEHRPTFSFRLSNSTRARLQAVADQSGLSLSEEIERRLEQSFIEADIAQRMSIFASRNAALAREVHEAATLIEAFTSERWDESEMARDALLAAVSSLIKPPAEPAEPVKPMSESTRQIVEALTKGAPRDDPALVGMAVAQVVARRDKRPLKD